jgi:uncharacterized membrane protein YeaQ/YmgE (transglycosylase-associated protein family)
MTTVMVMTGLVGVLAGLAARAIMPGKQIMGFFGTAIVGVIGALGAGYGGQAMAWYKLGEPIAFVAAVVGAIVLIFVVSRFFR